MSASLCGVWVDETGRVNTTVAVSGGGREMRLDTFRPFAWLNDTPPNANLHGLALERLQGPGAYDRLVHADNLGLFESFVREAKAAMDAGTDAGIDGGVDANEDASLADTSVINDAGLPPDAGVSADAGKGTDAGQIAEATAGGEGGCGCSTLGVE